MGRGFEGVGEAAKKLDERRQQQSNQTWLRRFKIDPGKTVNVRFLEQGDDVAWAWVCQLPAVGSQRFGDFTPTRDQVGDGSVPCPMGERGMPRTFRGWINLIQRDAPVLKRDENNRGVKDANGNYVFDGIADQLFVWETGIMVFEELRAWDRKVKGLMSRDFSVERKGSGLSTKYDIAPADIDAGPIPMSAEDLKLADGKHDLNTVITPKSYEDIESLLLGGSPRAATQQVTSSEEFNPFMPSDR